MADVLLTHSYLLKNDPKQLKVGQPYPPLGTLYAASVLREGGFNVSFFDMMFSKGTTDLEPVIMRENPRILVIYEDMFSYIVKMCLTNMRDTACKMIDMGKKFGCTVIVGSPDASDNYEYYLTKGADFCINGEGEHTLKELVSTILGNESPDFSNIQGISWKSPVGIKKNRGRDIITELDSLPFPAWDLVDANIYRKTWKRKNRIFSVNMVTTRGCPYQCIWCSKPIYGNHYNSRSPMNVIMEMFFLQGIIEPDHIWFADDIFALKPGWIAEFARLTQEYQVKIPYTIQSRVDLLLEDQQVGPLAESGCTKAWLGIESGSQEILNAMRKGTRIEQVYEASPKLKHAGIQQAFFLQLGFPGETREDIRKTIRLLTDLMPDDIGISVTYPLPGTKFYEEVKKDLKEKSHWTDSDDLALMFNSNFSTAYYKTLHRFIHKYYRARQALHLTGNFLMMKLRPEREEVKRMALFPYYMLMALVYKILLKRK